MRVSGDIFESRWLELENHSSYWGVLLRGPLTLRQSLADRSKDHRLLARLAEDPNPLVAYRARRALFDQMYD